MVRNRIPASIVRKVIWWYLHALSMEEIAAKVGISKTSVHNVIESKNTLRFKLSLYRKIAVDLAKKGLNIDDYADIIRAGKLLEKYGIHKSAAWHAVAAIPIACFKIGIEPYKLVAFLHRFEQLVAISKAKTLKDAFEYAKTSVSTYFFFLRRKFEC
jgi:predicted DNA-binding protein YlxM (UPF0122 family)